MQRIPWLSRNCIVRKLSIVSNPEPGNSFMQGRILLGYPGGIFLYMKYIFAGRVHPERVAVTISQIERDLGSLDTDFRGRIKASIYVSQINVELETDSSYSIFDLKNVVETFIYTMTDAYGYIKGYAYSVEITSVYIPETGGVTVFGVDVVKINEDEKNRPLGPSGVLDLALKNPRLYMVLKDLRHAISHPMDTFFHCRRATETIMKQFMKTSNKAEGWNNMIKILKLNEFDINDIKDSNGGQRHGEYQSVTGERRVEIMMKTWKVVDKFVKYLKEQETK